MLWTATIKYQSGSGWLTLDNTSGQNNGSVRAFVNPKNLPAAAGTYTASILIDGGPIAGSVTIPVTLTVQVTAAPTPPASHVTVSAVVNAATFAATPLVPGSLGTHQRIQPGGPESSSVTFDGVRGTAALRQRQPDQPAGSGGTGSPRPPPSWW